jgi:ferredoxin
MIILFNIIITEAKMSLMITAECINCGACEPECPNNAIYNVGEDWTFADGTTVKGQIEYHGETVDVNAKLGALSDSFYFIVPEKCTECVGFYDEQKCVSVCPVDCCVEDPDHRESQEELMARKERLHPA